MKRIGIAASKIAKGNLFLYNVCVVAIAFLISLLIFLVSGSLIALALFIMRYVFLGLFPGEVTKLWFVSFIWCLVSLAATIGFLMFFAILSNLKFHKEHDACP